MKRKLLIIMLSTLMTMAAFSACVPDANDVQNEGNTLQAVQQEDLSLPTESLEENTLSAEGLAPDFSVPLLTGETFTLSEHIGMVVVLDFWTTWCGACVAKMPFMQYQYEQQREYVVFLGINIAEDAEHVQSFMDERGLTYPIGLDLDAAIHRFSYPSPGIPFTVIIGKDGVISDTFMGGGTMTQAQIVEAIEAARL